MELKIIKRNVVIQQITYKLSLEEIVKIQDEVDLEVIDDEYTLFIYLENNIAKKSIEEKINDFDLIAYEDDILEQIKNYKND